MIGKSKILGWVFMTTAVFFTFVTIQTIKAEESIFGELNLVSMETKQAGGVSKEMTKEKNMIDGVGRLQWGKGMESTYIGALTVTMKAMGEDVTYDYLMGVSGAAFRLHIHHPGWCPSAPDATCGYNHGEAAMKAMGYKSAGIHSSNKNEAEVEKVRNAVIESIDRGYPVVAIDLKNVPDWGVIVGYTDWGKEFLCRTYYDETEEYSKAEKWPWVVEIIKEKTEKPDRKKIALESIRIAVEIASADKYDDYTSGFNAYETWIADLLNDKNFEDEEKSGSYSTHANAWSYSSLGDARSAAIKYLRSIPDLFSEESIPHLTKAADIYQEILDKLKEGFEYAPYPWALKDGKKWTAEMRHAEANVLKEVLALEKEAIKELETVLSLEEKMVYSEVLLEKDVKEFDYLTGRIGHHAVTVRDEVYTQPCVYLSLHLVQMRAAGWKDVDFDQIAAVSGASALFAYEEGTFMPKYANLHIGMDDRIAEATGFGYEWVDFDGIEGAWELIKESIDSGKSVKGWDWENIMFAGYHDALEPEDRKVYAMADGPDTYSQWWSWKEFGEYIKRMENWKTTKFGRHTERVPTKPKNAVALRVIKDLVEWSTNPPEHLVKRYPEATWGLAGIELYGKNCADMEKFEDFGSCHGMNPQWPIRNSSSIYLKWVADENVFPDKLNKHLLKAADEYKAAYVYWKQFFNHLSYGGGEGWGKIKEHRMAGAEGIRKALEHEKKAIDELRTFLEIHENGYILGNLNSVPRATTHIGALEGCLKHLGIEVSPGWLYGSTGHAFIMNIGTDLCGSGPHCWNWSTVNKLGKNIGYEAKGFYTNEDKEENLQKGWDFVRESIDNGFPCYGWHYEFMVINGYDDNGYFLSGALTVGDDPPEDWRKFGIGAVGFLDLWSIRPGQKADDMKTVKDALSFAINTKWAVDDSRDGGLAGYDNWMKGLETGEVDAFGAAYHAAIWAECRRYALDFLEEANQRMDMKYNSLFQPAIEQYSIVSDSLNEVEKLFPLKGKIQEEWKQNIEDAEKRHKAVDYLKTAKASEAKGIEFLGKIVAGLEE
ncbi:hypothetical protein GF312_11190 [Candidatus Poribacteria bacterium]|nr:hypothetical protein [Candidatus Poribacteria bacterium]